MLPPRPQKSGIGLALITLIGAVVMALVLALALVAMSRQQAEIEAKAQRIFDVAVPLVFESTRIIRGLERLARDGESILYIDDPAQRAVLRQRLHSLLDDGVLQGDGPMRKLIGDGFAVLDQSLADLGAKTAGARDRAVQRWGPVQSALFEASEKIGAEVSVSASNEADSIIETAHRAQRAVYLSSAAIALVSTVIVVFVYFAFTLPVLRLARDIRQARSGGELQTRSVLIRELQVLSGAVEGMATAHRDLEAARAQMEQMAHTDALTGLPNRRMFELRGEQEFSRVRRHREDLAAIAFDIDHFKRINDSFGHEAGDAVLRALAGFLLDTRRASDLPVARVGGEEFTMLIVHADQDSALAAAERVRAGIEALKVALPDGSTITCTASFGVAVLTDHDADLASLIQRADAALYKAKNSGRNCVVSAL